MPVAGLVLVDFGPGSLVGPQILGNRLHFGLDGVKLHRFHARAVGKINERMFCSGVTGIRNESLDAIERLRDRYKPPTGHLRVVFLGESRPDPVDGPPRMFYIPELSSHDNLFRGLMKALYDAGPSDLKSSKHRWVRQFQEDGFWLLDVVPYPVNHFSQRDRKAALLASVDFTASRIKRESPSHGIIICHAGTFHVVSEHLKSSGLIVLHEEPIPFPLAHNRPRFANAVRKVLTAAGIPVPIRVRNKDPRTPGSAEASVSSDGCRPTCSRHSLFGENNHLTFAPKNQF